MSKKIKSLTCLLLLFAGFFSGWAQQNKRITVQVQNGTVLDCIKAIENQTDYTFLFNNSIGVDKKVTVSCVNQTVGQVLASVFTSNGIAFDIQGNQITLRPGTLGDKQQDANRVISGIVTDQKGEPLVGVGVILVEDPTKGTITDTKGNYSLPAQTGNTLQFSSIGMKTINLTVGKSNTINVNMDEDLNLLDKVIVVGYGSQKRANLTGAVASVDADVIKDRPLTNLGSGLQGAIGNLNISIANGRPGTGATYNVRGTTNLVGASALVLVDGVEMDPNLINPADVKDVVVLKDASSSAIYGAKAAFGVIMISTKSGSASSKPVITFSGNYSLNTPTFKPESMNSLEYVQWMNDANTTTNGRPYFDDLEVEMVNRYFNDPEHNTGVFHHPSDAPTKYRYCGNTDWYKTMNKSHYPIQQYNTSISGGNQSINYYSSLGYYKQGGISKWADEDYERITNVNNITYNVTRWLQLKLKTAVSLHDNDSGGNNKNGGSSLANVIPGDSRPIMPLYHPDGHFSGQGSFTNVAAWQSLGGSSNTRQSDFLYAGSIRITPFEGFVINGDYTYNYYHYAFKNHTKEFREYQDEGFSTIFPHTSPNSVSYNRSEKMHNILNLYSEYTKQLAMRHNFKAMVGFSQELLRVVGISEKRSNLISNDIPYLSLATGDRETSDSESELAMRGLFFRFNYNYDEKYLLEISGRFDGSSRFPKEDRFKAFPSFSLGWRVSKESFWEPLSGVVNDFKLRASWGSLGNQVVSSYYPYISTYGTQEVNYLFNGIKQMGVTAPGLVSDDLTWETVTTTDFGLDAALFDSRMDITFDWYKRTTKDMLTKSKTLPATLGTSEPQMNAADLEVKGWEGSIGWRDVLNNGLIYNASFILSDYQGRITKYDNPTNNINESYYVGKKLGEIWGFETAGLFQTDEEASSWNQSKVAGYKQYAGDVKLADINGDGVVDYGSNTLDNPGDRRVIGNNTPRFSFGLRLGAEWRNFDLTLFFQGVMKREVLPSNPFYLNHYTSQWSVPLKIGYDYWREDNKDAFFPRARLNGSAVKLAQTRFLQDASYIRLKNMAIGYSIPSRVCNHLGISKLRVFFNADNAWEYSRILKIFDPELTQVNAYPFMRAFSFGANLTL